MSQHRIVFEPMSWVGSMGVFEGGENIITIGAYELWSFMGFDGGRLGSRILDILDIKIEDEWGRRDLGDEFVSHLVRNRLIPICPVRVDIEVLVSSYNRIRVVGLSRDDLAPDWAWSITADVTFDDLMNVANEIEN